MANFDSSGNATQSAQGHQPGTLLPAGRVAKIDRAQAKQERYDAKLKTQLDQRERGRIAFEDALPEPVKTAGRLALKAVKGTQRVIENPKEQLPKVPGNVAGALKDEALRQVMPRDYTHDRAEAEGHAAGERPKYQVEKPRPGYIGRTLEGDSMPHQVPGKVGQAAFMLSIEAARAAGRHIGKVADEMTSRKEASERDASPAKPASHEELRSQLLEKARAVTRDRAASRSVSLGR